MATVNITKVAFTVRIVTGIFGYTASLSNISVRMTCTKRKKKIVTSEKSKVNNNVNDLMKCDKTVKRL